jgi:hypothetical protein
MKLNLQSDSKNVERAFKNMHLLSTDALVYKNCTQNLTNSGIPYVPSSLKLWILSFHMTFKHYMTTLCLDLFIWLMDTGSVVVYQIYGQNHIMNWQVKSH